MHNIRACTYSSGFFSFIFSSSDFNFDVYVIRPVESSITIYSPFGSYFLFVFYTIVLHFPLTAYYHLLILIIYIFRECGHHFSIIAQIPEKWEVFLLVKAAIVWALLHEQYPLTHFQQTHPIPIPYMLVPDTHMLHHFLLLRP